MKRYFVLLAALFLVSAHMWSDSSPNVSTSGPLMMQRALQDEKCRHWVDSMMNELSLKEKVGQLFIYTIAPVDSKRNLELLREAVSTYKIGGLLFSGGRLQNQVSLTNRAQRQAKVPLMITFDGEWGLAMRLRGTPVFPRNMLLGCIQDNQLIYEYGREMARQCHQIGVQVNFAPVADVNINPLNPVINTRSFGENPQQVAAKVIAYASGLEEGGVLSVSKHFPGHGDTDVDSHKALPLLSFSRERLDSVELYPFKEIIRSGLSGIMVGHLQVPAIESQRQLPSSLSRSIVHDLLVDELAFRGLIFTDALAMKGVAGHRNVCLQALKAGNDVVLAPRNLKEEVSAVMKAIEEGELSQTEIEHKCRKVLMYKYVLGLNKKKTIAVSGLEQRLNTPQTRDLIRRLNLAAITVVDNKEGVLPLYAEENQAMALLEVGGAGDTDALASRLSEYTSLARFSLRANQSDEENQRLCDSLAAYRRVLIAISEQRLIPFRSFFELYKPKRPAVYLFFVPDQMMLQIRRGVERASAVVLGHSKGSDVQRQVADVLFAKTTANGRLSASLGEQFVVGSGVDITPQTPLSFIPDEHGLSSAVLAQIDSVALDGMAQGAFPGCQVVVMKGGRVLVDRTFGTHAGAGSEPVRSSDLYDLASLSKTTGTLLSLMKLYDKGLFNLTDKISTFLPFLQHTDKKDITIQDLLFHQSGLPSSIAFYQEAIDKESYRGKLFSTKKDAHHPLFLGSGTWANPNFKFKKEFVSVTKRGDYTIQISDSLWLNSSFEKVIEKKIAEAKLGPKRYVYSDVGFILLGKLVDKLAGVPMDVYLQDEIFEPMGLKRMGYRPRQNFASAEIVPSSVDLFLRKTTLQGFVHDEAAAFNGGVAGNAGLFANARDVARIYQMLLNDGELDGQRYLSKETCRLFTNEVSKQSRRGLGFDKPDTEQPEKSNCAPNVPASVYGHTGFTGTCAWVDPENDLVYVFLSNRVYPDASNRKLNQLNIRERIQAIVYDAMMK